MDEMLDEMPLVSVAIASYNGEKFIREQLDSIYNQTYKNIEVVVTDDCSRDKTVEILREYHEKHGLRYYVNDKNLGLIKNFEKAMSLGKGKYIALADQDDVWKPEKIETLVNEIGDYTLAYSHAIEVIDERNVVVHRFNDTHLISKFGTGKPIRRLIAFNWIVSHQILFKRELIDLALPIPSSQHYHDAWLGVVAAKMNGVKFVNKDLMKYRQHQSSLTYANPHKAKSLITRLFRFALDPERKVLKHQELRGEIRRLTEMREYSFFERDDRDFISNLIAYYQERLNNSIHWKSLRFAINNMDLFSYKPLGVKLKFILDSSIN